MYLLNELNIGGLEVLALDVCKNSSEFDLDIFLVSLSSGDLMEDFIGSGIKCYVLKINKYNKLLMVLKLRKIIVKERVDLIHVHESEASVISLLSILGLKKIPLVRTVHGFLPKDSIKGLRHLINYLKQYIILKINFLFFDKIIAVSNSFRDLLCEEFKINKKMIRVIYNGIDFKRVDKHLIEKNETSVSEGRPQLGMIGNFDKKRDQLTICKALPKYFDKFPQSRFSFIGGKSSIYSKIYEQCMEFCKEKEIISKINFLGKRKDALVYLAYFDLFVYSTLFDTFGISVIEAMYGGVPVLVSDIPVMLEISNNGKYCLTFKSLDHEDLSKKLIDFFSMSKRSTEKTIKAKRWVERRYSIERHLKNLSKTYDSVIVRKRRL